MTVSAKGYRITYSTEDGSFGVSYILADSIKQAKKFFNHRCKMGFWITDIDHGGPRDIISVIELNYKIDGEFF